jgi:hypothetical protein
MQVLLMVASRQMKNVASRQFRNVASQQVRNVASRQVMAMNAVMMVGIRSQFLFFLLI